MVHRTDLAPSVTTYANPVAEFRGSRFGFAFPAPLLMRRAGKATPDVPAWAPTVATRIPKVIPVGYPSIAGMRWKG
jgi:hypothetical protein